MLGAGNYLSDVKPEEAFYAHDGTYLRNLYELLEKIDGMSDVGFEEYVNTERDDFRFWIDNSVGDKGLSNSLAGVIDLKEYVSIIRRRIKRLEIGEAIIKSSIFIGSQVRHKALAWGPILSIIIAFLLLGQVGYLWKMHSETELRLVTVDQKMSNFISKQITADNILFMHLVGIEQLLNLSVNRTTFEMEGNFSGTPFLFAQPSPPQDRIPQENIIVSNRSVSIFVNSPQWAAISDTKSMEPVLAYGSHAIGIEPSSPTEIQVGDIVSYRDYLNDTVIHRVAEMGYDDEG